MKFVNRFINCINKNYGFSLCGLLLLILVGKAIWVDHQRQERENISVSTKARDNGTISITSEPCSLEKPFRYEVEAWGFARPGDLKISALVRTNGSERSDVYISPRKNRVNPHEIKSFGVEIPTEHMKSPYIIQVLVEPPEGEEASATFICPTLPAQST
jgi:hypothetical protein